MFKKLVLIILVSLLGFSCSKYQKLLKSSDYDKKYEAAVSYYEKGDFVRAFNLLEELQGIFRGTNRMEKVDFYLAGSYFGKKEYVYAGYHYGLFARTYPQSKYAEEAMYKSAYCSYLNASSTSLDSKYTVEGIKNIQIFIDRFPKSRYVPECNKLIDELRGRLEDKAYNNAKLYYNLSDYKAAVVSLKNLLKDYPDTKYREEVLYLILKSSFNLAEKSIEKKQRERYQKTVDEYFVFVDEYPQTKKIKEAEKIYQKSKKFLTK